MMMKHGIKLAIMAHEPSRSIFASVGPPLGSAWRDAV
jgi:hypothetical protein